MNKKILAVLMALMMVLTSAVAFAAPNNTTEVVEETSFDLTKTYTGEGKPNETFIFAATTVTEGAPALTLSSTTIENEGTITVTVPGVGVEGGYKAEPGVYNYTITETAGDTLGTTYDDTIYNVKVTVYNAAEAGKNPVYKTTISIKATDASAKSTEAAFTNTYTNSAKTLVVKKQIAGNAAVMTDTFTIQVTFDSGVTGKVLNSVIDTAIADSDNTVKTSWNGNVCTIEGIGHNDTVTFSNLPVGTTYEVVETDNGGYTKTEYDDKQKGTIADANIETVVTNTNTTDIDTGVFTDNMPYFMLMAFVMILAAAVVLKKRTVNE